MKLPQFADLIDGQPMPTNPIPPIARYPLTQYKVEGWNDPGGSCTYGAQETYEAACERARQYAANGDDEGRRYENWVVLEMLYEATCTITYRPVAS
jgi:hypothetical protein